MPFERFLHFLVVTSFLLLVITGMPLKFYYTSWAKVLFRIIGGAETARALHRLGAIVTFLYFGLHVTSLVARCWVRPQAGCATRKPAASASSGFGEVLFGPDSMMPTVQDWKDFVAHNKWFFGKGPTPAVRPLDLLGEVRLFRRVLGRVHHRSPRLVHVVPDLLHPLPAGLAHQYRPDHPLRRGVACGGFIFSIHFFNTHFRIEKFPMDTVIFSGRVSKNEMLHERRRWYDRLVAENRLEDFRVRDEWLRWRSIARTFGYFFFGLGVILLLLIIYAMITRLLHN